MSIDKEYRGVVKENQKQTVAIPRSIFALSITTQPIWVVCLQRNLEATNRQHEMEVEQLKEEVCFSSVLLPCASPLCMLASAGGISETKPFTRLPILRRSTERQTP